MLETLDSHERLLYTAEEKRRNQSFGVFQKAHETAEFFVRIGVNIFRFLYTNLIFCVRRTPKNEEEEEDGEDEDSIGANDFDESNMSTFAEAVDETDPDEDPLMMAMTPAGKKRRRLSSSKVSTSSVIEMLNEESDNIIIKPEPHQDVVSEIKANKISKSSNFKSNKVPEEEVDLFMQSLSATIKTFPPKQIIMAKIKLMQVVSNIQLQIIENDE